MKECEKTPCVFKFFAYFLIMKLENHLEKLIPEISTEKFDVIAYELTHDGEGWSVNRPWYLSRDSDKAQIMADIRGRWEVFKENYLPRGRVCDITDDGDEDTIYLDCQEIPFLELRKAK